MLQATSVQSVGASSLSFFIDDSQSECLDAEKIRITVDHIQVTFPGCWLVLSTQSVGDSAPHSSFGCQDILNGRAPSFQSLTTTVFLLE